MEILDIIKEWGGIVGMIVAGILLVGRKSDKLESLEITIKDLIVEIKNLVTATNDNKIVVAEIKGDIKNLDQRITTLEKN